MRILVLAVAATVLVAPKAFSREKYGVVPGLSYGAHHDFGVEASFVYLKPDYGEGYAVVIGRSDLNGPETYVEFEYLSLGDVHGDPLLGVTLGAGPLVNGQGYAGWQSTASCWFALPILPYVRYTRTLDEADRQLELGALLKFPIGHLD